MHILHIVGSISPAAGGPTEVIRMLIHHQPPGLTAEAVTLNDPAEPFLQTFPFKITALGSPKNRWYVPALKRWLQTNKHRFDGVIVHGLWEYTGIAAHQTLGRPGQPGYVPYVVFPHGMLDPYFKRTFPRKHAKKWLFWSLFQHRVLRDAYRTLFTTATEEKLAQQSFSNWQWTPIIVPLGSEPPPNTTIASKGHGFSRAILNPGEARASAPEVSLATSSGIVTDKPYLLFLGRIDPKKAPDILLKAFGNWTLANPNTALDLVMAGPCDPGYLHDLQTSVLLQGTDLHRIHWPGLLRGNAKWSALAACEAFILTSHQENFGIAVVEALASGKPVLISDQINIAPDIAADGAGLVEPDTLEGATRLLQRWNAMDEPARQAMSQQARRTFEQRYDMRRNTEKILRIFESRQ